MAARLLLDTHAAVWTALDPSALSRAVRQALEDGDHDVFFSPVNAMEIATKVRIGKMEFARPLATGFAQQMTSRGFVELPLTADHAEMAGAFLSDNQDPWDRLLAAQARRERMPLVTSDGKMDGFGIERFW